MLSQSSLSSRQGTYPRMYGMYKLHMIDEKEKTQHWEDMEGNMDQGGIGKE